MNIIEQAAKEGAKKKQQQLEVNDDAQADVAAADNDTIKAPVNHKATADTKNSESITLDLKRLKRKGYLTHEGDPEGLITSYRMMKRPILFNVEKRGASASVVNNPNLIMVTSVMQGEGKTYNAINLASSIAMERDKRVLLIDADVERPSIMLELGADTPKGLCELLLGEVDDLASVMLKTNIPKLSVLSAGRRYVHSTELLASDAMRLFIKDISSRYSDRIIIVDSPPLLLTTEAGILASHMGQVVVVVEAENTTKSDIDKGLALLTNEIKLLVLNKQRGRSKEFYGYSRR